MNYKTVFLTVVLVSLGTLAYTQTLAEVQLVTAIATELNPAIKLPRGSYRAVGEGTQQVISEVENADSYTNFEVYTATGITAALQPVFVQQISTAFAVTGYFIAEQTEKTVGSAKHTSYIFDDGSSTALLYTIRTSKELIWVVAKGK